MNEGINYYPKKLKSVIHYVINKCNVKRTEICGILYFSDFNFYELYEVPITGERYIKKPDGFISSNFIDLKKRTNN